MSKTLLVQTPEYDISAEFLWFGVILHSNVYVKWTKGVRRRFRASLGALLRRLGHLPVYAFQTPSHDPMKRKFIMDVGGVLDHYRYTDEGERAEMYRFHPLDWSKGNKNGQPLQEQDRSNQKPV